MESNGRMVVIPRPVGPAETPRPESSAVLVCRPWCRTTSREPALFDIRLVTSARELLPPQAAVQYWRRHGASDGARLRALGAPSACVVDCGLGDLSWAAAAFGHTPIEPPLVLSVPEEEIFRNLDAARTSLSALHGLGAIIRVTGCGTRFLAVASHHPLPADQAVIDTWLRTESESSALKRYWVITDIIRRAGATIFTECQSPPAWLAAAGVDYCTSSQARWCRVPACEAPAADQERGSWRKVGLQELSRPSAPTPFANPFVPYNQHHGF